MIFASEKRKQALLFLQDGTREMEDFLSALNTTRQALLPQMKVLEKHYLVSHYKDTYELTSIGKLLVDEMVPLVSTLEVFDTDIDYWGTHDFSFIPPHLFKRINEIRECTMVIPALTQLYEVHRVTNETSKKYNYAITTFFYPNFKCMALQIVSQGADLHVILPQSLLDKLKTDSYNDFKELLSNDLVHFYLYPKEMNLLVFVCNEQMVMISPLTVDGSFDNKHVLCKTPTAINWAKDVFDHYLRESEPITEV